jgi:class 3 adenylate cyclase
MPNPATTRVQRLRNTKAQLIHEIETLEQRAAPIGAKAGDRDLADLARFPSENPNPVLRAMPDGRMLYANEAARAVKGLLKGRKKPTLARGLTGVVAAASRTAEVQETAFESGDRVFAFSIAAVTGETYLNIYGRDITERRKAEEALAEKEELLRVVLESIPSGVRCFDKDNRYSYFNSLYGELWDLPDGLLKIGDSRHIENTYLAKRGDFGEGDIDELVDGVMYARTFNTEQQHYERTTIKGKILDCYSQPTDFGGFVSVHTDITERRKAEEELARKEAQLRVALDNMPGGIVLADKNMNCVLFNAQYSQLLDFPDGLLEVGGSMLDELRYQAERGDFGPGDTDKLTEEVAAIYERGEAVSLEREIAGSGRTVQIYTAPTPEGGYVTIATDITERKRAEEALLVAKRRAEEASELVAEKNRMLESLSNQLSKYLSPQVYASIFSGAQSVEIASKRKKLTIFFSDIADFTETTDSLESEELTNLLNHYLTEMSKIALDFGATIDKYVGDSIIAFFGDPETRGVKEDAKACVNMAIAMQRRMRELQSEWLDMGLEKPFELRIGINTGFCTVGNFGSAERMDYTIIGNEVNLAARLESLAKTGGILLAHETHALVKDTVLAEEGDALTVKGFAKPVRTYSVVGLYDDLAEQGKIIRKEQDGVRVLVDLTKGDRIHAIQVIKGILSQLKE